MIRAEEIEVQRQIVRRSPFGTKEYDREFDKLHKMCMEYMAELYVRINCKPYGSKTPYDE